MVNPPPAATLLLMIAAPFVGSFLAAVAYRLPRGKPVLWGRSACPACGTILAPAMLIPFFGYAWRGGACWHCKAPIPRDYPLAEMAALAAAVWAVMVLPGWTAWAGAILGWYLLTLAVIDARHFLLPDALTLPLLALGFAVAAIEFFAPGLGWKTAALDAAIGAASGFLSLAFIAWVYLKLRGRAGLGLGDAKLLAASGAWVGWQGLASTVLIAALAALAVSLATAALKGRRPGLGDRLPFGPYLALGTWLVVLYGPLSFRFQ